MTSKNKAQMTHIRLGGKLLIAIEVPKLFSKCWVYWDGTAEELRVANDGSWIEWFHTLESKSGNPNDYKIIGFLHEISDEEWRDYISPLEIPKKELDDILINGGFRIFNTNSNVLILEKKSDFVPWFNELRNHLNSLSEDELEKMREDFKSQEESIPDGWVDIELHLPQMLVKDIVQGYSTYKVMNIDGEIFETIVSDHNVWYYQAKKQGITHWFNGKSDY